MSLSELPTAEEIGMKWNPDAMSDPEPTQLDRIEAKLDRLLADHAFIRENAPKIAEEIQKQLSGTLLGKMILKSIQ